MNKKIALLFVIILVLPILSTGCIEFENEMETMKVRDAAGREVDVPTEVEEVVGVGAGALRLLVYMNATEMVVGVEDFEKRDDARPYVMANPGLQDKPSIGPMHGGDTELIMDVDPDVIFWSYAEEGEADDLQSKTGIPVVVLDYGDLGENKDSLYEDLNLIGKVLGKEKRAKHLQGFMNGVISDLNDRTKDIPEEEKNRSYVGGIGHKGAHGMVSTRPRYTPLELVNGKNVAGGLDSDHAMVDKEQIVEWDPEMLFVDMGGYELVMEDLQNEELYEELDSVKNDEIYGVMPFNYYTANFGTILISSYYVGEVLFPEHFEDVKVEKKADEIYGELVGEDVFEEMKDTFGGFEKIDMQE